MTMFDYAVLVVIGLSVGLGWWRGFVYELLSLLGWMAAYFVARLFAAPVSRYVPDVMTSEVAKMAVAYAALFIATLIVSGIVALLLSKLIHFVGLGWMDSSMGLIFGLLRGLMLVLILVLLAGVTNLPKEPFWRDAWSSQMLQNAALFTKDFLPEKVAKNVAY
jgi:membrane protein required for colicin V production